MTAPQVLALLVIFLAVCATVGILDYRSYRRYLETLRAELRVEMDAGARPLKHLDRNLPPISGFGRDIYPDREIEVPPDEYTRLP
jgi:hypothetical protein